MHGGQIGALRKGRDASRLGQLLLVREVGVGNFPCLCEGSDVIPRGHRDIALTGSRQARDGERDSGGRHLGIALIGLHPNLHHIARV